MIDIFLTLAGTLRSTLKVRHDLVVENLALRHQLSVLMRSDGRVRSTFCLEHDHALLHCDRDFDPFEEFLELEVVHPGGTARSPRP